MCQSISNDTNALELHAGDPFRQSVHINLVVMPFDLTPSPLPFREGVGGWVRGDSLVTNIYPGKEFCGLDAHIFHTSSSYGQILR